jgi:hypothetical protein
VAARRIKWGAAIVVAVAAVIGSFFAGRVLFPDDSKAREEGYAEGRRAESALNDGVIDDVSNEASAAAARYTALGVDLFLSFSSMDVAIEAPENFVGGVAAAASSVRDDAKSVENVLAEINALPLGGRRLEVQRQAFASAQSCLDTAASVADALEAGETDLALALQSPLVSCWVRVRDRVQRIGYQ